MMETAQDIATPTNDRTFVFVDTETAGLDIARHGIIQIGAYATGVHEEDFRGYFVSDVNPLSEDVRYWRDVDEKALAINGFTMGRIRSAPSLRYVLRDFSDFVNGHPNPVLVFHNAPFDAPRLAFAYADYGITAVDMLRRTLCTISLGFALTGESLSLAALAERFGISNKQPHDALADAITTSKVFHAIRRELPRMDA